MRLDNLQDLIANAEAVLRQNDAGIFTKPGPKQYPHQWNWDSALIALGLSHFDLPRALLEIRSLFTGQWNDGMLPHVVYHTIPSDYFPPPSFWQIQSSLHAPMVATSGITQPPILATILRMIHNRTPILGFLREIYPSLLAWHRWLHTARDADGSGLVCIIHPWESGTDDSPRWLELLAEIAPTELPTFRRGDTQYVAQSERPNQIAYDRFIYLIDISPRDAYQAKTLLERSPFLVQDVLFNSILCRADEDLRAMAVEIGQSTVELDVWQEKLRASFNGRFWDERQGLYFDHNLRSGKPIQVNTATTFLPLYAGLASLDQAERVIRDHWLNPVEYAPVPATPYRITTTSRSEPAWEPRRYWRGPIWIIMNWLLTLGLACFGNQDLAGGLRQHSLELVSRSGFREYYDTRDGSGCGSPDFSWSAALTFELAHSIRSIRNQHLHFGNPE